MMDLNLAYPEKSDIKYVKTVYKDGQVDIAVTYPWQKEREDVRIISRMNSYQDLFTILSARDALRRVEHRVELCVPCFFGQRSDRRFSKDSAFGLKLITDTINAAKFNRVITLHPHSDVLPALLDNCRVVDNHELVDWAFHMIGPAINTVLVSPDAGAYKQMEKISREYKLDLLPAVKARVGNEIVQNIYAPADMIEFANCVIIDDYIDGGRTFSGLAKKLKDAGASKVVLIVTHGLFSYGYDIEGVDQIFCTNSIQDIKHPGITQMEII